VFRERRLRYYASYSLFRANPAIEHVVVLVHGVDGSASLNFKTLVASAHRAESSGIDDAALASTLLIAPHFPNDSPSLDIPKDRHRWTRGGWAVGSNSVTKPRVSSFAVMDQLVVELTRPGRFPNLKTITVAGHSAGGQLAQRYAATTAAATRSSGVHMRYVAANPSSFLYLRPERPFFAQDAAGFGVPYGADTAARTAFLGAPSCPDTYDRYRYGLQQLNVYASRAGAAQIKAQYALRDVLYLTGQYDTLDLDCAAADAPRKCREMLDKNGADLDLSCPAVLQGPDRRARARHYQQFMDAFFPDHRHRSVEVPGANHSSRAMFDSAEGVAALFGQPVVNPSRIAFVSGDP